MFDIIDITTLIHHVELISTSFSISSKIISIIGADSIVNTSHTVNNQSVLKIIYEVTIIK